jgi:uncharacterized protein YdeI (YjbR/CyaY-like superfamily)
MATNNSALSTLELPEDLIWALDFDQAAKAIFETFSFTRRMEFVRWLENARQPEIRAMRLAQALRTITGENQAVAS